MDRSAESCREGMYGKNAVVAFLLTFGERPESTDHPDEALTGLKKKEE